MFFLLSKLLTFLLSPLVWVLILLITAVFVVKSQLRKKLLIAAIIVLYFFSNGFICNEACRMWEYPFTKPDSTETFDYAIVLGGYSTYDTASSRVKFIDAADRFIQAYQLYQRGIVRKFFLSGGSGSVLYQDEKEADKIKTFLVSLKVPVSDISMEKFSRNTHENAVYTQRWLMENDPGARCLLITSAAHMRRALGCYKKAGVNVTPYTTHRLSEPRKFSPDKLFVPKAINFMNWDSIIKEITGTLIYKVVGYI